ncbi:MAG: sulfatase-like hydrolase/transferase [Clostridia bacterium]|nr:sulfatase-like hydrolase/transferase [Clostridia bacterium]
MKEMNVKNGRAINKKYVRNLILMLLFFPISVFYLEMIVRLCTTGAPTVIEFINIFFFSFSFGAFISFILSLIKNRTVLRIIAVALIVLITIIICSQMIYFQIFRFYYSLDNASMAGQAVGDFGEIMWKTIGSNIGYILILAIPAILMSVFNKVLSNYPTRRIPPILNYFCVAVMALAFICGSVSVATDNGEYGSLYYYRYVDSTESAGKFGILTSMRLELQAKIFGKFEENVDIKQGMNDIYNPFETDGNDTTNPDVTDPDGTTEPPAPPIVYGDNVMENLDFSKTSGKIGELNKYFSSLTPTKKNEYTGMFEGYNLIFLSLEGFSHHVIDPNLTPTLYMMANEGFVFENFYNSVWGGSTSTGEYANLTGNFYNSTACMQTLLPKTYQPFTLGNQFKKLGYTTKAYHAWTHTYYNRDESHPVLGYEWIAYNRNNVKGYSGLEDFTFEDGTKMKFPWVPSDHDTARITVNDFVDKEPFHVYYMTISGHTEYNWTGNAMCKKHKAFINSYCQQYGLNYSDKVKAYLACQYEVELMLTELVDRLREAGVLDRTVFAMGADHYPYGLWDDNNGAYLAELYGIPADDISSNFELYRNAFIIWNSAMEEPIHVDTPCSAIDILPTLSNLFGLEYDSRLMAGTDVLSDIEPVVIVNFDNKKGSWNWITKYGSYTTSDKKFTLAQGFTATDAEIEAYVKSVNQLVSAKRKYSFYVIENDYYAYVFGKKE